MTLFTPRLVCARCGRPETVCYCAHLTTIETATRVVLLQHPRERDVPIGTARMASLCLPNSELHVGVSWGALGRALADAKRPAALLYPGAGATDVLSAPPREPITLVVVDGTWSQTKKVVKQNPALAALPRYSFVPPAPSEYRIRREPDDDYVSTIEALAYVLGALEGDAARFTALLAPFRAMVDGQLAYAQRLGTPRTRHVRPPRRKPRPPAIFQERAADLVCVVGEANAWPIGSALRPAGTVGELVHWVARRLSTGETFESVIAPRTAIAPSTQWHVGLSDERLRAGVERSMFHEAWRSFVRDGDLLCAWGSYGIQLLAASGWTGPREHLDLRRVTRVLESRSVGALETFHAALGEPANESTLAGRGGRRLEMIDAITRRYAAAARDG